MMHLRPHNTRPAISARGLRTGKRREKSRGAIIVEFLLSFPILFIVFLAMFEFAILVLIQQAITHAAIEGAREGAKVGHGTDIDDVADGVAEAVQQILIVHGLVFDTTGNVVDSDSDGNDDLVRVTIERNPDGGTAGTVTRERGNLNVPCEANGPALVNGDDAIRVTVCVQVTDPTGMTPVPDWLASFGMSLAGREFQISSRAILENTLYNP